MTLHLVTLAPWRDRALCRDLPPDEADRIFYPIQEHGHAIDWSEAREFCAGCPARFDCLEHAMEHEPDIGWWGGKSPQERQAMRQGVERRGVGRPVKPCGTHAAYIRHRRDGEPACAACLDAHRRYVRAS